MERIYNRKSRKVSNSELKCDCPVESLTFFKTIDGFANLSVDGMRLAHCYMHHKTRKVDKELAVSIERKREQDNLIEEGIGDVQDRITGVRGQGVLFGV